MDLRTEAVAREDEGKWAGKMSMKEENRTINSKLEISIGTPNYARQGVWLGNSHICLAAKGKFCG